MRTDVVFIYVTAATIFLVARADDIAVGGEIAPDLDLEVASPSAVQQARGIFFSLTAFSYEFHANVYTNVTWSWDRAAAAAIDQGFLLLPQFEARDAAGRRSLPGVEADVVINNETVTVANASGRLDAPYVQDPHAIAAIIARSMEFYFAQVGATTSPAQGEDDADWPFETYALSRPRNGDDGFDAATGAPLRLLLIPKRPAAATGQAVLSAADAIIVRLSNFSVLSIDPRRTALLADYHAAWDRWSRAEYASYHFTVYELCPVCPGGTVAPKMVVSVDHTRVASVVLAATGADVTSTREAASLGQPVEKYFLQARRALLEGHLRSLVVAYDPALGYPVRIRWTQKGAPDDPGEVTMKVLQALDEGLITPTRPSVSDAWASAPAGVQGMIIGLICTFIVGTTIVVVCCVRHRKRLFLCCFPTDRDGRQPLSTARSERAGRGASVRDHGDGGDSSDGEEMPSVDVSSEEDDDGPVATAAGGSGTPPPTAVVAGVDSPPHITHDAMMAHRRRVSATLGGTPPSA